MFLITSQTKKNVHRRKNPFDKLNNHTYLAEFFDGQSHFHTK
jgi:hypothetical protein